MAFSPETLGASLAGVAVLGKIFHAYKIFPFNSNGAGGCLDPNCQGDVKQTHDTVINLEARVSSIDKTQKILLTNQDSIGKNVADLSGYIRGKLG